MGETPAESAAETLAALVPRLGRMISGALEGDPSVFLSLRQYRMLERLTDRPHRTSELATISGVSQPTASGAIASLEGRGLVERKPDPNDRRATRIFLTEEGRAILELARRRVLARLWMVTERISEDEAHALLALRPTLTQGMDRAIDRLRAERNAAERGGV